MERMYLLNKKIVNRKSNIVNFLVIAFAFLFLPLPAQQTELKQPVSLDMRQEPLSKAFSSITAQTGFRFAYNTQLLDAEKKISIQIKNQPLDNVLAQLLPTEVHYKVIGKYIILAAAKPENKIPLKPSEPYTSDIDTIFIQNNYFLDRGMLFDNCHNNITINIEEMNRKLVLFAIGLSAATANMSAQTEEKPGLLHNLVEKVTTITTSITTTEPTVRETKPLQLTFVYPLGTGGVNAFHNEYNFSLNVLGGATGKVNGVELGGIINVNKFSVKGVQAAGVINFTGISSNTEYRSNAVQLAGVINYNNKGISEQIGGCINLGDTANVQLAGVVNLAKRKANVQISGTVNAAKESEVQIGGVINASKTAKAQIAGTVNIASESKYQISGVFNGTQKGGFQLGLVNVRDSIDGVSIGLVNIVKKDGLMQGEISTGEIIHLAGSFRSGSKKLYGIVTLGYNFSDDFWAWGYGLGTMFTLSNMLGLNIEAVHYNLNNSIFNNERYQGLVQVRPTLNVEFAKHFNIFAGPTLNLSIIDPSDIKFSLPYNSLWNTETNRRELNAWVGFTAGIRL